MGSNGGIPLGDPLLDRCCVRDGFLHLLGVSSSGIRRGGVLVRAYGYDPAGGSSAVRSRCRPGGV